MSYNRVCQRIASWYGNLHRKKKTSPTVPKPVLDVTGKSTRKKPPLQKWQAYCIQNYRPLGSPLRDEVEALYASRDKPTAISFILPFLPPDTDLASVTPLAFLSAFMRERCTHLSPEEDNELEVYIEEQELLALEHRDQPWFLDDDYEDKPLLAENRYIQA
jgi:hypothetical protein